MTTKGGADIGRDARARRQQLKSFSGGDRGFDRGVLSGPALEDVVIGKDLFLGVVDVGALPFVVEGLAAQAIDSAAGLLSLGLYRVAGDDIRPTRWKAQLAGSAIIQTKTVPKEFCGAIKQSKETDRTTAAWLVAVLGSTSTMTVRGTLSYTSPSFAGWTLAAQTKLPATVQSADVKWSAFVPSVALLSLAGLRLRGTGMLPA